MVKQVKPLKYEEDGKTRVEDKPREAEPSKFGLLQGLAIFCIITIFIVVYIAMTWIQILMESGAFSFF